MSEPFRIGLLGHGTVGSAFEELLEARTGAIEAEVGLRPELSGVLTRSQGDFDDLLERSDLIVELMGGIEPARTLILQALNSGADVITANKAVLANHGPELFDAAEQVGAQLYYEAAVGGAIPIIRPLRDSLAGDRVTRILGIVNGTTNFILDRMDTEGDSLEDALAEATRLGYAEADPTADVEGFDAAQKAAILASLAFHTTVPLDAVHREGMTTVTH